MAIHVGVVAEREIEAITQGHQTGHRGGGRAVHANLAVLVHGHEPERRVHSAVDHLKIHKAQLFYYLKLMGRKVDTMSLWGV